MPSPFGDPEANTATSPFGDPPASAAQSSSPFGDPPASQAASSASHYDSLAPRPQSFWQRAYETVAAPIREGSIGQAFHQDTTTEAEKVRNPALRDPTFVRLSEAKVENALPKDQKVARGVVKGVEQLGTGLFSPENVLMLAGSMGLGAAPAAVNALQRLVSAGFYFQMVKSAASMSPKLLQQIKIGDIEGAAETLTEMAGSLGMAYAGAKHAVGESAPGMKPPPEREAKGSHIPAAEPKTGDQMTRDELVKWHEQFERDHTGETKSPFGDPKAEKQAELKEKADAPHEPPIVNEPGAAERFLRDEEGSYNPDWLKESTEEMRAKYNLRQQGLEALKKAESSPLEKDWGQRAMEWYVGERNVWSARVNQEISKVRKTLPNKIDQEALSLMRDFKTRPGELQQFANGTHPDLFHVGRGQQGPSPSDALARIKKAQPIIDRALNPTPAMLRADRLLTDIAEVSLLQGKKLGLLDSKLTVDEYVPHMLHPKDEPQFAAMREGVGSAIGNIRRSIGGSAKARTAYPTLLHAIADGAVPKTLNALDAFTIYSDKFGTARATKLLQMKLKDSGLGWWSTNGEESMEGQKIPQGAKPFAGHSNEFKNLVGMIGQDGKPRAVEQRLYTMDFVDQAFSAITDPDYTSRIPKFAAARVWQQGVKAASLSLSFFHAKALTLMATANMNPWEASKALRSDPESPEMEAQERDLILHGGTSDVLGQTKEAYHHLQPGSIPTWNDIVGSAPGIKQLHKAASKITEVTFGNLQRKYKVWDYARQKAAWIGSHPNATPAELTKAKISIAKQVNAIYGGLNWETLGFSRQTLSIARALMLAPDWTISNLFNVGQMAEGGLRAGAKGAAKQLPGIGRMLPPGWEGNAGGKAARLFWIKSMTGGIAATQLMSLALTGKFSPSLTQVYYGDDKNGNNILHNVFFSGAPGDLVNLINRSSQHGLVVGLAEWVIGKAAPGIRGSGQAASNQTWMHQAIIPKDMNPAAATLRAGAYFARDLSPIPFSAQNVWDEKLGPHADQYTNIEVLASVIAGTPPQHRPPAGMKQTKHGLQPIKKKEALPWLDQTITGKVYPSKNP